MQTQTEKKYAKRIGMLYYSHITGSTVLLTGLTKQFGVWRYQVLYSDPDMVNNPRKISATRVEELLRQGRWSDTEALKKS